MKIKVEPFAGFIIGMCIIGFLLNGLPKIISYCRDEYLVEETGYIHSTGKENKCRFIKIAKERDYKISRISKDDAIRKGYKICHDCYIQIEQDEFNEKRKQERMQKLINILKSNN